MIVFLVTVAAFVNYVDRGNLATAAPLIQDQLQLSATHLGVLSSAFYYGYVFAMAPLGWLAERFGAKRILAIGVGLWSVATLLTGLASTFPTLLACRVLLGIGESAVFPCASKLFAQSLGVGELGLANGIMSFGYLLGPAVGTLLGGLLMSAFGWRPVFILFGAVSALWLWPWSRVVVPAVAPSATVAPTQPPMGAILRQRALWGAAVGLFAANYTFYFILAWLPFYLVKARGFSIESMSWTASWAYLLNAVSALALGWLTDRWVRRGRNASWVYKGIMGINHVAGIGCMAAMVLLPGSASIVALFVYEIMAGLASPGIFAIPQIIAGPTAAGRWVGVQNAVGAVAGIVAPTLAGVLEDRTGGFAAAFTIAAAMNVVGFVGWVLILPKVAPLKWSSASA
jgi:MFS family permease